MLRVSWAVFLLGCGGSANKTLDLTLTYSDGTVARKSFASPGGFFFDGRGKATAAFPPTGEWTPNTPLGLSVKLHPLQPGRAGSSGNLHAGGNGVEASKSLVLDVSVERVRWQADGAYPFRLEGSLKGNTPENHRVEGRFSTTMEDCTDSQTANSKTFLCGGPWSEREQKWQIDSWVTEGSCPDEIFKRYAGGPALVINGRFASLGGLRDLRCVTVSSGKVVCGESEEGFSAEGCSWAIAVIASPGSAKGPDPFAGIYAGTTGDSCPAKLCALTPRSFVHVSGAE